MVEVHVKPKDHRFKDIQGETKTLQEWADERGIKYPTLYRRVVIMGRSAEQALNQ